MNSYRKTTAKSWLRILETLMSGALLENFTASEIVKSYYNSGREPFVYYYRDKDTKEIDLIIEGNGKLYPIEIKKTAMLTLLRKQRSMSMRQRLKGLKSIPLMLSLMWI